MAAGVLANLLKFPCQPTDGANPLDHSSVEFRRTYLCFYALNLVLSGLAAPVAKESAVRMAKALGLVVGGVVDVPRISTWLGRTLPAAGSNELAAVQAAVQGYANLV